MQIALVSDIHSNLVALEAVLEAMPPYDELWCLGDTIGYGPRPNECLAYMRDRATHVLTGNHDLASLGEISLANFNSLARDANLWNNKQLEPELRAYLSNRLARLDVEPEATLAHASPRDPIWEYILDSDTAFDNLSYFTAQVCLVGHSHVPLIYAYAGKHQDEFGHAPGGRMLTLQAGTRYIINPGSVGQPRDGDPRAAYAIWDTEQGTVSFERVLYDIKTTQQQMREAKLPELLAERLEYGR